MSKNDFFIGWAEDMPTADRRTFLAGGVVLSLGALAGGGLLASRQNAPGRGTWNMGDVRTFKGIATSEPYGMLRTSDIDGTPRTALLVCMGKCGVAARIGSYAGKTVGIRGSLIQRGRHTMIAVVDDMDWIAESDQPVASELAFPVAQPLGEVTLDGTILDTKCWFGAMRPSTGKIHKSCASLCIRGGIPPAFFAKDRKGQSRLLVMTEQDGAFSEDLLPFVADPVRITGQVKQRGDLLFLDSTTSKLKRL